MTLLITVLSIVEETVGLLGSLYFIDADYKTILETLASRKTFIGANYETILKTLRFVILFFVYKFDKNFA